MARVGRTDTAFQYKQAELINAAIAKLALRVKRTLSVPSITYREMLQLIAPSEHINTLMAARQVADISRYTATDSNRITIAQHKGYDIGIEFSVGERDDDAPVMPKKTMWLDHFPENRALALELVACGKEYADVAIDWGVVKHVFKYLNKKCKNPQQMRYIWPPILGLLAMHDDLHGWREQLAPNKVPRSLPTLPPEVRTMCRQTAGIVAMALMLPPLEDEGREPKIVEISYRVGEFELSDPGDKIAPLNC